MKFSVGICAYNEERNIRELLKTLLQHQTEHELVEIIVVSSGCTDRTEEIVREFTQVDGRVNLIVESERKGKYSAINQVLKECRTDILVMTDADDLPGKGAIDNLLKHFKEGVGAVVGRTIPLNERKGFWGYVAHFRYGLFHSMALKKSAEGEYCHLSGYLYAMRTGIVKEIPKIICDDMYIGLAIKRSGYDIIYEPEAIVYIMHPTTLSDFIKQRKNIRLGHIQIKRVENYRVPSTSPIQVIPLVIKAMDWNPLKLLYFAAVIAIEQYVVLLSRINIMRGNIPLAWDYIGSSKQLTK